MSVSMDWSGGSFSLMPLQLPDVSFPKLNEAISALDPLVPRMLRDMFVALRNRYRKSPIFKLSPDIWVDHIFTRLAVEDVIALRQTCKLYYLLTQEPTIWRRFLENLQYPVPPLRPTWRYGFRLTDYEIEHLVTQSISVEDNWRRPQGPKIYNQRFLLSELLVNEVFIVPGGRFLLVSCMERRKPKPPQKPQCYLYLYMLDHPHGPAAVCRIPTFLRAYNIQAKYVQMRAGETGMLITYTRRVNRLPQPPGFHEEDLSTDFGHKHDVVGGFRYNIAAVYVNMNMVEWLKQPDIDHRSPIYQEYLLRVPNPFRELMMAHSGFEITQTEIIEWQGKHFLVFIALPHELHFVNVLDPSEHVTCALTRHQQEEWKHMPHRIRAFRVWPNQNNMVVIRSISVRSHSPAQLQELATPTPWRPPILPSGGEREVHLVEWYELPKIIDGVLSLRCDTRYVLDKSRIVNKFTISEVNWPNRLKKAHESHPRILNTLGGPPPCVSIYMEMTQPFATEHHQLFPVQTFVPPNSEHPGYYEYSFTHLSFPMHLTVTGEHRPKVLPGAESALVCLFREGDITSTPRIHKLRRYVRSGNIGPAYDEDPFLQVEDDPACPVTRRGKRLPLPGPKEVYRDFNTAQPIIDDINANGGLRAIAWDESTGRIVIASDREEFIRVIDTGAGMIPDGRTEAWVRQRMWLHQELAMEAHIESMMQE